MNNELQIKLLKIAIQITDFIASGHSNLAQWKAEELLVEFKNFNGEKDK